MGFQSLTFLVFLPAAVLICRMAGRRDAVAGRRCLLIFSLIFYMAQGKGLTELLIGLLVTALAVGYFSVSGHSETARKRILLLSCGYHIAVLAAFKYVAGWMPVGLSFFTFQQLWLLKEGYEGSFLPRREELLIHALFFPTVTSGPILRPGAFFPQLEGEVFLHPGERDIAAGLYAICMGTAKKVLLADQLGMVVSNGWAAAGDLSVPAAWITMVAYTLQLYLDFSGYCDIATGCARLLGLRLPVNFNSPYRSLSVGEFWKRWHITLTTFLRECLYIPLGGSRKGTARTCLHIMVVFLVSGLWHGNGWTFVVWGLLHGLAQVDERLCGARLDRLPKLFRWALTMFFVNFAWVFFRAPDMTSALTMLTSAVSGGGVGIAALSAGVFESEMNAVTTLLPAAGTVAELLLPVSLLAVGTVVCLWPRTVLQKMEDFRPTLLSAAVLAVLMLWAVLSFSGVTTFIYSNF